MAWLKSRGAAPVVGPLTLIDVPALAADRLGAACITGPQATHAFAILRRAVDLDTILAADTACPDLPIWVANVKGPKAATTESALHAARMTDTKPCAISPALSGTRDQRLHR